MCIDFFLFLIIWLISFLEQTSFDFTECSSTHKLFIMRGIQKMSDKCYVFNSTFSSLSTFTKYINLY